MVVTAFQALNHNLSVLRVAGTDRNWFDFETLIIHDEWLVFMLGLVYKQ